MIFEPKKARYFHSGLFILSRFSRRSKNDVGFDRSHILIFSRLKNQSSISRPLNKRLIISIENPR